MTAPRRRRDRPAASTRPSRSVGATAPRRQNLAQVQRRRRVFGPDHPCTGSAERTLQALQEHLAALRRRRGAVGVAPPDAATNANTMSPEGNASTHYYPWLVAGLVAWFFLVVVIPVLLS